MKIARIISCELDSTLHPTMKRGFDIIPTLLPELIGVHAASEMDLEKCRFFTIFRTFKSSYATMSLDITTHLAVLTAKS